MSETEYIRKQIVKHISYEKSIVEIKSAFRRAFYHPKTGNRITWNERCSLVDKDLHKRIKRIQKKIKNNEQ